MILSESRGGMIGFAFSFFGVLAFNLVKGHKIQLSQMLVFMALLAIIFFIFQGALFKWWETFKASFGEDLNDFSTGRMDIYKQGFEVFKAHPLFGGGWLSLQQLNPGSRLIYVSFNTSAITSSDGSIWICCINHSLYSSSYIFL